jgi:hypothetical protein
MERNIYKIGKELFITSDEEIKDCWVLNTHTNEVYFLKGYYGIQPIAKKIVLTTDQSLDSVQSIPDEFLEWFVKNPSCDEVEVKHKDVIQYGNMTMYDHNGDGSHYSCKDCEVETTRSKEELLKFGAEYYKIIIPKKEPKQETENLKNFKKLVSDEVSPAMKDFIKEKQETLEEAAEKFSRQYFSAEEDTSYEEQASLTSFIAGAKWQAERMYSEEEVIGLCMSAYNQATKDGSEAWLGTFDRWFEQFKKK